MKEIYWRPKEVSKVIMILLSIYSFICLVLVETFLSRKEQPYWKKKMEASRLADKAFKQIKQEKEKRNEKISKEFDPLNTGLIGYFMTPVTSNTGVLEAKQTSINPNFAAVIVDMLKKSKVKDGDTIALGLSGSFPSINICVYAAASVLQLKVISISSLSASQWGANDPDFLWIDMERVLYAAKIFSYKSEYVSLGGIDDSVIGMTQKGKEMLFSAVERNKVKLIPSTTLSENINRNYQIYQENSFGVPIKAYINVGGGSVSVGTKIGKRAFKTGLNLTPPVGIKDIDSVMTRFINEDIPVIHLVNIKSLAEDYGLPTTLKTYPNIGEGSVYFKKEYNLTLAGSLFLSIILLLYLFFKTELGIYIYHNSFYKSDKKSKFEPTV
jgi:poly-gamma-glutamate system protein